MIAITHDIVEMTHDRPDSSIEFFSCAGPAAKKARALDETLPITKVIHERQYLRDTVPCAMSEEMHANLQAASLQSNFQPQ